MRISDWSSDVCSSDLAGNDLAIDDDGPVEGADIIPGDGGNALDERHAGGQIAADGGQLFDAFRDADQDEIAAFRRAGDDAIKTNRRAGRGVPDKVRLGARDGGEADERDARKRGGERKKSGPFHPRSPSSDVEECRRPSDQVSRSAMW